MSVSTKKPKLDYLAMLGDPDEQKPRTLHEIADEVGFPFTARATRGGTDACSVSGCEAGEDAVILGPVPGMPTEAYASSQHPQLDPRDGRKWVGFNCHVPRWILLGHK